jgi:nitrite reductase (cytochrome c-552)
MPYKSEGGVKFTDHKIQSPLNNVANSCQVCHREETARLIQDVYDRQDRVIESRDNLEKQIVRAHVEAGKCWELGATEEQMKDILMGIRHAQWRWDYAAASHGGSFHSPVEISRVIASGLEIAGETRILLSRLLIKLGYEGEVPYPDIETKEKAQAFIGLDIPKLEAEKAEFKKTLLPQWINQAIERESKLPVQLGN